MQSYKIIQTQYNYSLLIINFCLYFLTHINAFDLYQLQKHRYAPTLPNKPYIIVVRKGKNSN
ncbi:Uncharacterised protein [Prevotella melaninogenica]|nr:Uncharacterised protein [Prevotella melaninogenica]